MTSVQVLAGPGLVARYGDVLVWMEPAGSGGGPVVADILALARTLAEAGGASGAGARVAEVLRRDPEAVPALVLVAPTAGGLQAVVHGWGRVLADGIDIDGGWADREIPEKVALAAGRGGDLLRVPASGSVLDLRRGSTPGGGAAVALREETSSPPLAPRAEPAAPLAARQEPEAAVLAGPEPAAPVVPRPQPRSAAGAASGTAFEADDLRAGPPEDAGTAGTTVKGVLCSRGHFNNPLALSCRTCGSSLGQVSRILHDGIRPSLGTLVLDDGTAHGLDTDHLLGTAPDAEGADGGTRPVPLVDQHGQIAPVHAEVRLVGWDVVLFARAPTFLLTEGTQQWAPVALGQPTPLATGARVAIGQRTFTVLPG